MGTAFKLNGGLLFLSTEAPGGVYHAAQLKKIAQIAEQDSIVIKATEDQRLGLFVPLSKLPKVAAELRSVGLGMRHYQDGLHQPVNCAGEFCPEKMQDAMAASIQLTKELAKAGALSSRLKIGLNGCGTACVPTHTLDISIIGEMTGYRISLGGKNSQIPEMASFMAEGVPADKLVGLVVAIVEHYKKVAQKDESLQDVMERCGTAAFIKILAPFSQDAHQSGSDESLLDSDETSLADKEAGPSLETDEDSGFQEPEVGMIDQGAGDESHEPALELAEEGTDFQEPSIDVLETEITESDSLESELKEDETLSEEPLNEEALTEESLAEVTLPEEPLAEETLAAETLTVDALPEENLAEDTALEDTEIPLDPSLSEESLDEELPQIEAMEVSEDAHELSEETLSAVESPEENALEEIPTLEKPLEEESLTHLDSEVSLDEGELEEIELKDEDPATEIADSDIALEEPLAEAPVPASSEQTKSEAPEQDDEMSIEDTPIGEVSETEAEEFEQKLVASIAEEESVPELEDANQEERQAALKLVETNSEFPSEKALQEAMEVPQDFSNLGIETETDDAEVSEEVEDNEALASKSDGVRPISTLPGPKSNKPAMQTKDAGMDIESVDIEDDGRIALTFSSGDTFYIQGKSLKIGKMQKMRFRGVTLTFVREASTITVETDGMSMSLPLAEAA